MIRRVAPALVVLAALVMAACDTAETPDPALPTPTMSETTTSAAAPSASTLAGLAALYAGTDPSPDEASDAACFAAALLGRLGPADLTAAGILDQQGAVAPVLPVLDVPTAQAWVEAQDSCVDFVDVSTRALAAQSKGAVAPVPYAECLRAALTPDQVDAARVDTLTGGFDTPEVTALAQAQARCARSASPPD